MSAGRSSLASAFSTCARVGFVRGCRGVKTVQQSSYGKIDVSSVPMRRAIATIYSLSIPMSGQNTGRSTTADVTPMASMVWDATCPKFSPVTRHWQP